MRWRTSRAADEDLIEIAHYGVREFGIAQAKHYHDALEYLFELIAANPNMGRRLERHPRLRRFHHGRHIVIYSAHQDHILIERLLHDAMNIDRHLGE